MANINEDYIAELLFKRYSAPGVLGAPRFIHIRHPHLTNNGGVADRNRILDYVVFDRIAQNKWGENSALLSSVRPVHGFEIKVSKSDVIRELKDLSKSEAWAKHVTHFWLVVADKKLIENLPEDVSIPDSWGILVLTSKQDKLRAIRQPVVNFEPLHWDTQTVGNMIYKAARTKQPNLS